MGAPIKRKGNRHAVSLNFRKDRPVAIKQSEIEKIEREKEINKWLETHQIKKIPTKSSVK